MTCTHNHNCGCGSLSNANIKAVIEGLLTTALDEKDFDALELRNSIQQNLTKISDIQLKINDFKADMALNLSALLSKTELAGIKSELENLIAQQQNIYEDLQRSFEATTNSKLLEYKSDVQDIQQDVANQLNTVQNQIASLVPTRDAYQIAVQNGYVGSEASWLDSLKGHSAYTIAKAHGFKDSESVWLSSLKGDKGPIGEKGVPGNDGISAYEVARNNGYVGSESAWLNTLIGKKGDRGVGVAHVNHNSDDTLTFLFTDNTSYTTNSLKGDQGIQGIQGITPYEQAVKEGFKGTVKEWLTSLKPTEGTLQALTKFMNNNANTAVTVPELGNIPSLQGHIKQMFENGGLPATPFKTKAEMEASGLDVGSYATVTHGTDNDDNGLYIKESTQWVKSPYNTSKQAVKTLTDTFGGVFNSIQINLYNDPRVVHKSKLYPTGAGEWKVFAPSYGAFIAVKEGEVYLIKAKDASKANYKLIASMPSVGDTFDYTNPILANTRIEAGHTKQVVIPEGFNFIWVSILSTVGLDVEPVSIVPENGELVSKNDIIHDTLEGYLEEKVLSGIAGKGYESSLKKLEMHNLFFEDIVPDNGTIYAGGYNYGAQNSNNTPQLTSYRVYLRSGETLSYFTEDFNSLATLTEEIDSEGGDGGTYKAYQSIHYSFTANSRVTQKEYTAKRDVTLIVSGRFTTDMVQIDYKAMPPDRFEDLGVYRISNKLDYDESMEGHLIYESFDVNKGDIIKITNPLIGYPSIIRKAQRTGGDAYPVYGVMSELDLEGNYLLWESPANHHIRVAGHTNSEFLISRANSGKSDLDTKLRQISKDINVDSIDTLRVPIVKETVFGTDKNYILKNEVVDGVDSILVSNDLGRSWSRADNLLREITSYHIFSDGVIALCSNTKVVTLSPPYTEMVESQVFDHDGSPYQPGDYQFFMLQKGNQLQYVGDKEIWVWGDYKLNGIPRVWYTTDSGKTIKCAIKFGTTVIDGAVRNTRHVHSCVQRRKDERIYLTTGDAGNQCFTMSMGYDVENDEWDFKFYGAGDMFKFGDIYFDDWYAYVMTDYTLASWRPKNGIYRVALEHLGDFSKYQPIYICDLNIGTAALSKLVMDRNGNRLILPDYAGAGWVLLAKDNLDFKKVNLVPFQSFSYRLGHNYNGDFYVTGFSKSSELLDQRNLRINRGSVNLTKVMRDAGITDFMTNGHLFDGSWMTN